MRGTYVLSKIHAWRHKHTLISHIQRKSYPILIQSILSLVLVHSTQYYWLLNDDSHMLNDATTGMRFATIVRSYKCTT
jgi:hypothetical protein